MLQLAHVLQTISSHPSVYFWHRHHFVPHMVNSLNRLGLPINCSPENRELSVSLVELILCWENTQHGHCNEHQTTKRPLDNRFYVSPSKKLKLKDGSFTVREHDMETPQCIDWQETSFFLDKSMIESITNFLVRLVLLITDGKDDNVQRELQLRIITMFRRMLSKWNMTPIHSIYFEKACGEDVSPVTPTPSFVISTTIDKKGQDKSSKSKTGSGKIKGGHPKTGGKPNTSKGAPISSPSIGNNDVKFISTVSMMTCLDLFIIMLQFAPHNFENSVKGNSLKSFLGLCFKRAEEKSCSKMRKNLKKFLTLFFLSSNKKLIIYPEVANYVKVLMEKALLDVAKAPIDTNAAASPSSASSRGGTGANKHKNDGTPKGEEKNDHIEVGLCVIQVIDAVSKERPEFVENFTACLITLGKTLLKRHIQTANISSRSMASAKHQIGGSGCQKCLSSPVLGIFEEAQSDDSATNKTAVCVRRSSFDESEQFSVIASIPEVGSVVRTLLYILRLIGSSSIPYVFTESRVAFFNLLEDIMDNGDNIQLLLTCVGIIGKWMLSEGRSGPITVKERNTFLLKITISFSSSSMPETVTQPLADLVSFIILSLRNWDAAKSHQYPFALGEGSGSCKQGPPLAKFSLPKRKQVPIIHGNSDLVFNRCLVSCLLSANIHLQPLLIALYSTQSKNCTDMENAIISHGKSFGCSEIDSFDVAGLPDRTPLDMLWQLLNSDFEGLAERLWTIVFVDLLIGGSSHQGGVCLPSQVLMKEGTSTYGSWERQPSASHPHLFWISSPVVGADDTLPTTVIGKVYVDFLTELTGQSSVIQAGRGRCLSAIRRIAHGDAGVCQELFERLLSSAWARLSSNDTRVDMVTALEPLLSQPYNSQFLRHSHRLGAVCSPCDSKRQANYCINTVQSFLRAVSKLQPLPTLSPELLMGLTPLYNSWYEVLHMLENQYNLMTINLSAETDEYRQKVLALMQLCYRDLGETDICIALSSGFCEIPGSQYALSLDMYGRVQQAMDMYTGLIDRAESAHRNFETSALDSQHLSEVPSSSELGIWEDRWVELNRELCQWEVISEYADEAGYPKLKMESAWKMREWANVRSLYTSPSLVASLEEGDPDVKINEVFLAIVDGKQNEVENLHAQTAQLCLYKWQLLPSVSTGSNAHSSLFQRFHRLVELRESGQIMVETSAHSNGRTFPDLKNLLR